MGKAVKKLSARAVATIARPGRHSDGDGLYLNPGASVVICEGEKAADAAGPKVAGLIPTRWQNGRYARSPA